MNELKANISHKIAMTHNIMAGIHAEWGALESVSHVDRMQRRRTVLRPVVELTATYTKTTTTGKPFKRATVETIKIKPIYCSQCGHKL